MPCYGALYSAKSLACEFADPWVGLRKSRQERCIIVWALQQKSMMRPLGWLLLLFRQICYLGGCTMMFGLQSELM